MRHSIQYQRLQQEAQLKPLLHEDFVWPVSPCLSLDMHEAGLLVAGLQARQGFSPMVTLA